MDMIGATAIRASFALLPVSAANPQSLMVRPLSKTNAGPLTLSRFNRPCDPAATASSFDLPHLDGKDLRQETLSERRALLKQLVGDDADSRIQFSEEFDGDGAALFKACAERALEGIVSKHALAPYRSGCSRTWLKTK